MKFQEDERLLERMIRLCRTKVDTVAIAIPTNILDRLRDQHRSDHDGETIYGYRVIEVPTGVDAMALNAVDEKLVLRVMDTEPSLMAKIGVIKAILGQGPPPRPRRDAL